MNKASSKPTLYIGLMSGTSVDGIDIALIEIVDGQCELLASNCYPIEESLKSDIHSLCTPLTKKHHLLNQYNQAELPENRIEKMAKLDHQLGLAFAKVVNQFINGQNLTKENITAIGCHGQTIRHRPSSDCPFTLQIGDPNLIAYQTGITTIADFRRMDMAAGGQGAPLVPAFHHELMSSRNENRIILNLGGIANITYLPKSTKETVIGFDTGPANTLLDVHFKQHHQKPGFDELDYDNNGTFAKTGNIDKKLLAILMGDPYFKINAPKSTGREYFSADWLKQKLDAITHSISPPSVQATLLALTVQTITDSIKRLKLADFEVYVCGGGMHNQFLLDELTKKLNKKVFKTNELGIDGDYLEAMTFAWLAHRRLENLCGNLTSVTGAKQSKVLGAIYHP